MQKHEYPVAEWVLVRTTCFLCVPPLVFAYVALVVGAALAASVWRLPLPSVRREPRLTLVLTSKQRRVG